MKKKFTICPESLPTYQAIAQGELLAWRAEKITSSSFVIEESKGDALIAEFNLKAIKGDPHAIYRDFQGEVFVSGVKLTVCNFCTFNDVPHWGIVGTGEDGQAILGWVPVALCEMPE